MFKVNDTHWRGSQGQLKKFKVEEYILKRPPSQQKCFYRKRALSAEMILLEEGDLSAEMF